jgi:[lysine-biosynthesis-protein LysW]--L-2-aminoadipate ligase
VEEKLLIGAMEQRGVEYDIIDDGDLLLDLASPDERWRRYDAVLCRSVSQSRGLALMYMLESWANYHCPVAGRCAHAAYHDSLYT